MMRDILQRKKERKKEKKEPDDGESYHSAVTLEIRGMGWLR